MYTCVYKLDTAYPETHTGKNKDVPIRDAQSFHVLLFYQYYHPWALLEWPYSREPLKTSSLTCSHVQLLFFFLEITDTNTQKGVSENITVLFKKKIYFAAISYF